MAIQHELVLLAFFQLGILICVVHDVYQVNLGLIFLLLSSLIRFHRLDWMCCTLKDEEMGQLNKDRIRHGLVLQGQLCI